jgi:hypothetical protein
VAKRNGPSMDGTEAACVGTPAGVRPVGEWSASRGPCTRVIESKLLIHELFLQSEFFFEPWLASYRQILARNLRAQLPYAPPPSDHSWGSQMSSLQQRIAAVTHATANLIAQLRELDRLRERVSKAKLSALRSRRIDRRKRPHNQNQRGRFGWRPF